MQNYDCIYEVPPLSRLDIRRAARVLRKIFQGREKGAYIDIIKMLESLSIFGIDYDIINDYEWDKRFGGDKHAQYDLSKRIIYIKASVYERACNNYGRDRFTIAHEIGHSLLLDPDQLKFNRKREAGKVLIYRNPEWQANCFAGELLVPYYICKDMSVEEIADKCKVSYDAAKYQKNCYKFPKKKNIKNCRS